MDNDTLYPVLEEATKRAYNSINGEGAFEVLEPVNREAAIDATRAGFTAVHEFAASKGYTMRTRMMKGLVEAAEPKISDDEALDEAIEAVDESDMAYPVKSRVKKALASIRQRVSKIVNY